MITFLGKVTFVTLKYQNGEYSFSYYLPPKFVTSTNPLEFHPSLRNYVGIKGENTEKYVEYWPVSLSEAAGDNPAFFHTLSSWRELLISGWLKLTSLYLNRENPISVYEELPWWEKFASETFWRYAPRGQEKEKQIERWYRNLHYGVENSWDLNEWLGELAAICSILSYHIPLQGLSRTAELAGWKSLEYGCRKLLIPV